MVSRHLNRMKERYALTACDIHEQAIEFLQTAIEVDAVLSRTDPDDLSLPESFDVVFALSFFSHVPDGTWGRWLRKLYSALANDGLLIFTTTAGEPTTERAARISYQKAAGTRPQASKRTFGLKIMERLWWNHSTCFSKSSVARTPRWSFLRRARGGLIKTRMWCGKPRDPFAGACGRDARRVPPINVLPILWQKIGRCGIRLTSFMPRVPGA